MRYLPLIVFACLILSLPGTGLCAVPSPDPGMNASENPVYWIHLDPVSDKPVNDTFVITGTTNIPAGKWVNLSIYSTKLDHRKNPPPRWYRQDTVIIVRGTEENNTFSTPFITPLNDITDPKFGDGSHGNVWVEGEYFVGAESRMDTLVTAYTLFNILPNETLPVVTPAPVSPDAGRDLWFFYGEECPHCHEVMPFIDSMAEKYPGVRIHRLEVYHNTTNQQVFSAVHAAAGITPPQGLPEVVIGNVTLVGGKEIRERLETILQSPGNITNLPSPADDSYPPAGGRSFAVSSPLLLLLLLLLGAAGIGYLLLRRRHP